MSRRANESRDEYRNRQRARFHRKVEGVKVFYAEREKGIFDEGSDWLVVVYTRVSTGDPKQVSSIEMQGSYYTEFVERQPNMRLIDIYADEGISGTSLKRRVKFNEMIADCLGGKKGINLIVVKSVSRFARNVEDFATVTRQLKDKNIGVFFELERLCTLKPEDELAIGMLSNFAQYESAQKSEGVKRANTIKFAKGNFTPSPFQGYDLDDDGKLVVNDDEARIIKLIYFLYLSGHSTAKIAEILMELGCKTKGHSKENADKLKWSSGTVEYILQNKKYYGTYDAGMTWTKSYKDHISRPNTINPETGKYFSTRAIVENHHEGIITEDDYVAAQLLLSNAKYGRTVLPEMKVIPEGALKGFVSLNPRWMGFSVEDYMDASESVYSLKERDADEKRIRQLSVKTGEIDFRGYEVVLPHLFSKYKKPCLSLTNDRVSFTTGCIRNLGDVQYVEILIEPFKGLIAVRPCEKDNRNAIKWARMKSGRLCPNPTSGLSFNAMLFDMFEWLSDYKRRLVGTHIQKGKDSFLVFDVSETEIIRPISLEDSTIITAYTDSEDSFGVDYYEWSQSFEVLASSKARLNAGADTKVYRGDMSLNIAEQDSLKKSIDGLMQELRVAS